MASQSLLKSLIDIVRNKFANVGSIFRDLFHQSRARIVVPLFRHNQNCLDIGPYVPVHVGHLKLEFEIRYSPQSANNHICLLLLGEVDEKTSKSHRLSPMGICPGFH